MALIKKTENGKSLVVNEATFEEVLELKKAFQEQLKNLDFDITRLEGLGVEKSIESLIMFLLNTETSERFEEALFQCLKSCTYENVSITKDLFNDMVEARNDYYEIIKECVQVNLRPFMQSLSSQFPFLTLFAELYQNILSPQTGDSK